MKKIYYSPSPSSFGYIESLHIPIKNNKDIFSKENAFSFCPAWNHQNSKTFTVYAQSHIHLAVEGDRVYSENMNQDEFDNYITLNQNWNEDLCTLQIEGLLTNFYWTDEKNVWISILPHPLTSLNNNFYHCGAWFNLSNWPRCVNIAAVLVDKNKPLIIKRGDPLYNIKFHTKDQNDKFDLIQTELNISKYESSLSKTIFILQKRHSKDYDYKKILFESESESKKCPFKFLWKK